MQTYLCMFQVRNIAGQSMALSRPSKMQYLQYIFKCIVNKAYFCQESDNSEKFKLYCAYTALFEELISLKLTLTSPVP